LLRILITNDDGYTSPGLYALYEAVKDLGEVMVFSTELPRSAVAHTISFNRPLRVYHTKFRGYEIYVTDGTPVDVVHLAVSLLGFKPTLVLSGVNVGENLSLQHVFYSGTLAAAIEAALLGIPAIAFSADVKTFQDLEHPELRRVVARVARTLAEHVDKHGFPPGVDVLSVNIPSPDRFRGCAKIAWASRTRWVSVYEERLDTRGRPYYWLEPKPVDPKPGSDVYTVVVEGCVAVTPLSIDMNVHSCRCDELRRSVEKMFSHRASSP